MKKIIVILLVLSWLIGVDGIRTITLGDPETTDTKKEDNND